MVSGGEVSSGGSCAHNKLTLVVIQQSTVSSAHLNAHLKSNSLLLLEKLRTVCISMLILHFKKHTGEKQSTVGETAQCPFECTLEKSITISLHWL